MSHRHVVAAVLAAGLLVGCGGGEVSAPDAAPPGPTPGFQGVDDYCPGSDHCVGAGDGKLYVGVATQSIDPVLVETEWDDQNGNNHYDSSEPFTDVNGNGVFDATWMAGFGNGRPATGFHDALTVRAIALRHGDTTVVIAILDVVGYFIDEIDRIKARPELQGLDVDHIIIGATHVHEAVDTVGLWGQNPLRSGLNQDYQELTRARAAAAIVASLENMRAAHLTVAQKQTIDPTGNTLDYVSDTRDPVIYDPTMTILRFTEEGDPSATIATMINWAAHPEYGGSRNNLLTADYVNLLRAGVETGLGGTVVFVNGALGGQVGPGNAHPIDPVTMMPISSSGLPKGDALGTNLAAFALQAIEDEGTTYTTDLAVSYRTAELFAQVDNGGYHALYLLDVFDRQLMFFDESKPIDETNMPWVRTRETYLQVGPVATITSPGELHPELFVGGYDGSWSFGNEILPEPVNAPNLDLAPDPPYLRDLMLMNPGVEYTFVSGLCEDFLGYIVASFNYVLDPNNPYFAEAEGEHYEETNSIGPLVEEQIQHPMKELANWRNP